jgi:hypothetical protein
MRDRNSEQRCTDVVAPSASTALAATTKVLASPPTHTAATTVEKAPEPPVQVESNTPTPTAIKLPKIISSSAAVADDQDTWLHHKIFASDLLRIPGLGPSAREEVLTIAWEYSRVIIPQYTNWTRFSCWVCFIIIGVLAEYEGDVVDIAQSDKVPGYDLGELLETMLQGRPRAGDLERDYRTFLLMSAEKCLTSGTAMTQTRRDTNMSWRTKKVCCIRVLRRSSKTTCGIATSVFTGTGTTQRTSTNLAA